MELTYMLILWNAILDTTWRRRRENWPQKVLAERKNDWSSWHLALLDIQSWKNLDLNFVTLLSKWFVTVCQKCFDLFRMTFFGLFWVKLFFGWHVHKCNFTFSNFEYSSSITKIVNESISEEKLRHLMPSFLKTGKNGSIHVSQSHAYSRHFFFNCIQTYFFFDGKMNFFCFWRFFIFQRWTVCVIQAFIYVIHKKATIKHRSRLVLSTKHPKSVKHPKLTDGACFLKYYKIKDFEKFRHLGSKQFD